MHDFFSFEPLIISTFSAGKLSSFASSNVPIIQTLNATNNEYERWWENLFSTTFEWLICDEFNWIVCPNLIHNWIWQGNKQRICPRRPKKTKPHFVVSLNFHTCIAILVIEIWFHPPNFYGVWITDLLPLVYTQVLVAVWSLSTCQLHFVSEEVLWKA